MQRKRQTDERLQLHTYKAGYYSFLVSFPLAVLTFLLLLSSATKDTAWAPIAVLVTFWAGMLTFLGYLWKHKVSEGERELNRRNRKTGKALLWRILLAVPLSFAVMAGMDYVITVYLQQESWGFTSRLWGIIPGFAGAWIAIYYTSWRKPRKEKNEEQNG